MTRYYPGFLAALLIILLRISIGWHFLNEGLEKVESTYLGGKEPFSAEVYLRNANGPFAPYFRQMIPDFFGLERLDPERLKADWTADVARIIAHYGFDAGQQKRALAILEENLQWATYWFDEPANAEKLKKYQHDIQQADEVERNPQALSYQKERVWDLRRALEADRRSLLAPLDERQKALRESVIKVALDAQNKSAGGADAPLSTLDIINRVTMFGLVAIGVCLILGFLTPLAALSAAAFLALIYFSMPPWPGLPPNPRARGSLPDRQQKPGRNDCLPGHRHDPERALDRIRRPRLRGQAAATGGRDCRGPRRPSTRTNRPRRHTRPARRATDRPRPITD